MAITIKGYECREYGSDQWANLRHDSAQPLRELPKGSYFFAGCIQPLVIYRHLGTTRKGRIRARELIIFDDGTKTIGIMQLEPWIRVAALADSRGRYLFKKRYLFRQKQPMQLAKGGEA